MREILIPILIAAAILCLSGCAIQTSTVPEYTMPEQTADDQEVITAVENEVERLAKQYHVAPELSDDFVSTYLDMDSFEELKERTKEGIAVTKDEAGMSKKEILMWQEIIRNKQFTKYTVSDLQKKQNELNEILQSLATEKGQPIEEYVKEHFGMDMEETATFLESQAEKYLHN